MYHKRQVVLVRGEGARVWDADGREYVDCTAGIGVAALGHAHPVVVEALTEQAARLVTCHEGFYNDQRARLFERYAKIVPPGLNRFFLCNSGTEAIEGAIKLARLKTERKEIFSFRKGFHGRTMGALSATATEKYRKPFQPLVPEFKHFPYNRLDQLSESISEWTAAVIVEVTVSARSNAMTR